MTFLEKIRHELVYLEELRKEYGKGNVQIYYNNYEFITILNIIPKKIVKYIKFEPIVTPKGE